MEPRVRLSSKIGGIEVQIKSARTSEKNGVRLLYNSQGFEIIGDEIAAFFGLYDKQLLGSVKPPVCPYICAPFHLAGGYEM
jgi:hypothetical protein